MPEEDNRPTAADDIDHDRIMVDQEYRRKVMARLNASEPRKAQPDRGSGTGENIRSER